MNILSVVGLSVRLQKAKIFKNRNVNFSFAIQDIILIPICKGLTNSMSIYCTYIFPSV